MACIAISLTSFTANIAAGDVTDNIQSASDLVM